MIKLRGFHAKVSRLRALFRLPVTLAARANASGWDCSGCMRQKPGDWPVGEDPLRYVLLLWALFKPELYRKYRKVEALEALQGLHLAVLPV